MAVSAQEVRQQAEQLMASQSWAEVHALLTDTTKNPHQQDPELCWRAAWSCHEMANIHAEDNGKRKEFTFEGFKQAKQGLSIDPEHGYCNLWFGIFLDLTSAYEGVKKRILNANAVKEHFDRAYNKNPEDALTLHSMGVWHFECADIDWEEMEDAASIEERPKSTFENALLYFQQAEEANPDFYSCNLLYLGKCHQRMGKEDAAKRFYARCMEFKGNSLEDQEAKEEARAILSSL